MFSKLKFLLVAGVMIASLPLLSTANDNDGDNGKAHDKVTLCHNGHSITISRSALQHHLDNHNKDGAKLTCFEVTATRPCGSTPPPPPCNVCPPKPPCTGCAK